MYQFFYALYYALFTGDWQLYRAHNLPSYLNRVATLIMNTLGGQFTTLQTYELVNESLTAFGLISNILAVVTMIGICLGVLKLTKMVFSIFFGGR